MIKFTIVTCTFRAAGVLERTLQSVLHQSYSHVEHLILDGGSKDETVPMALAYQRESLEAPAAHDVVVRSEPDHGLYDAMNKGIRMASGDYILFLNAGDVFPSADTLEAVAESVGEGEQLPGVLYGDTDIVDEQGNFLRHRRLAPPQHLSWRSFKWGMLVCHQAFYARADLAKGNLYDDATYRLSADVDWCIRIMKDAEKQGLSLRRVPAVVVNYLDGGMSVQNHRASLQERFLLMSHHYGFMQTVCLHIAFVFRALIKK